MITNQQLEDRDALDEQPLTAERRRLRRILQAIDGSEQMRRRSIQQAILQAESWVWAWRAEQFHAAAPRQDEYHGRATNAELAEAYWRCRNTALACLRHAQLLAELAEEVSEDD
jgi:hypothetical protein